MTDAEIQKAVSQIIHSARQEFKEKSDARPRCVYCGMYGDIDGVVRHEGGCRGS